MRLRVEDGRVIFAEDIAVGRRVRDVHQHSTGEIVLWTDTRELIFLRPGDGGFENKFIAYLLNEKMGLSQAQRDRLAAAFERCRECHSLRSEDNRHAPSLAHIFGSRAGSKSFGAYSNALRQYAGSWTKEALRSYIRAPQQLIPGTTMPDPGIGDDEIEDGIVTILEHLTRTIETPPQSK